jgi:hypothetical protein
MAFREFGERPEMHGWGWWAHQNWRKGRIIVREREGGRNGAERKGQQRGRRGRKPPETEWAKK